MSDDEMSHIHRDRRGEDLPVVLISWNSYIASALISGGDREMLPAISFVHVCRILSIICFFFSFSLTHMQVHTDTFTTDSRAD